MQKYRNYAIDLFQCVTPFYFPKMMLHQAFWAAKEGGLLSIFKTTHRKHAVDEKEKEKNKIKIESNQNSKRKNHQKKKT